MKQKPIDSSINTDHGAGSRQKRNKVQTTGMTRDMPPYITIKRLNHHEELQAWEQYLKKP